MLWEVLLLVILLLLQVLFPLSFDLRFIGPMCLRKYPLLAFQIFWNISFQNIFSKSLNFDLILLILVFSMFLVILAKGLISILIIYLLWTNSLMLSSFCLFFINFFPWLLFHVTYLILVCLVIFFCT